MIAPRPTLISVAPSRIFASRSASSRWYVFSVRPDRMLTTSLVASSVSRSTSSTPSFAASSGLVCRLYSTIRGSIALRNWMYHREIAPRPITPIVAWHIGVAVIPLLWKAFHSYRPAGACIGSMNCRARRRLISVSMTLNSATCRAITSLLLLTATPRS